MKAKSENPDLEESSGLNDEDKQELKVAIHKGLSTSITFAEVMQIINNALVNETEQRFEKMTDEEAMAALSEVRASNKDSEDNEKV